MKQVKRVPKTAVPNFFTILNMFFGFTAIIYAMEGHFLTAILLVYIATFMDLLDGRVAKLLGISSHFGAEFDSLTDMITFGVAPALIVYHAYFSEWEILGVILAFFPMCFSALRLARFNIRWPDSKSAFFQGIPTPISAHYLIGLVAFADQIWGGFEYPALAVFVVLSASFLMVSNIPFESNVIENPRKISSIWKLIPFFLSVITVVIFGLAAIFFWACFYILIGLIRWILYHLMGRDLPESVKA